MVSANLIKELQNVLPNVTYCLTTSAKRFVGRSRIVVRFHVTTVGRTGLGVLSPRLANIIANRCKMLPSSSTTVAIVATNAQHYNFVGVDASFGLAKN